MSDLPFATADGKCPACREGDHKRCSDNIFTSVECSCECENEDE